MLLVVDANIVLSALTAGRITDLLLSPKLELVVPDLLFLEVEKHKEEIKDRSKLSGEDFETLLKLLGKRIKALPLEEFSSQMPKAEELLGEHKKDAQYVALALKLNCPFWTYEKRFADIGGIKSLTTADVAKLIKSA